MIDDETPILPPEFDPFKKLNRDLKTAAKLLGKNEVRYLVSAYYTEQSARIRAVSKAKAAQETGVPNRLLDWNAQNHKAFEANYERALDSFTDAYTVGIWMKSICGIGPIITAGCMAHIDIVKARTAGHIIRFAGLDPDVKWAGSQDALEFIKERVEDPSAIGLIEVQELCKGVEEGGWGRNWNTIYAKAAGLEVDEFGHLVSMNDGTVTAKDLAKALARRPWHTEFKTLVVYKLGECFVKVQNNKKDFYGKLFAQHKKALIEKNERGEFAEQAAKILEAKDIGKGTDAYAAYSQGKLPPAHIHARSRRWTVKLFLSHLHHVMYQDWHGEAPLRPWIIEKGDGDHRHYIPPPNWPLPEGTEKGKSLRELAA